jgi:Porin subfamily
MKMVKGLFLGSAAGLIAMSGAQAADLPVKAKAVEYVKVCSLYGAGFYYIPGTDTCIRLGGYMRIDTTFNGSAAYNDPAWSGASGQDTRQRNQYISRVRQDLDIDTRTATEYGVVRTYFDAVFNWTTGTDSIAGGGPSVGVYYAFIQFAGFTMGKAVSEFSTPWTGYPGGNLTSYLIGGQDDVTGINQLAYTASFGSGVSATISLEDSQGYDQSQLLATSNGNGTAASWLSGTGTGNPTGTGTYGSFYGGAAVPDIVGQVRVDQAWGLFQASVAAHDIHASYYVPSNETSGHPSDAWGFAGMLALSIKNIPTGPGDSINIDTTFANGASRYVIGGVTGNSFAMFGGTSAAGAYQSIAVATSADGIFGPGGQIEKTNAWGIRGGYNHNWDPYWSTSLFGSYSGLSYNSAGKALFCTGMTAVVKGSYTCDPDFQFAQFGVVTRWTPVKNLTFSGEVMYTQLYQNMSGTTAAVNPGGTAPTAVYQFKDQGTVSVAFRAQRNF